MPLIKFNKILLKKIKKLILIANQGDKTPITGEDQKLSAQKVRPLARK